MGKLRLDISPFLSNIISLLSHSRLSPSFSLHECFLSSHKLGAEMPSKERRCSVTVSFFVAALCDDDDDDVDDDDDDYVNGNDDDVNGKLFYTELTTYFTKLSLIIVCVDLTGESWCCKQSSAEEERQVSVCTRVCEPV